MNDFQHINGFGSNSFGASPDGLGAHGFGAEQIAVEQSPSPAVSALKVAWALAGVAGAGIGAYHGYKRNDSVGWAIGWAFLGGIFPVFVIPIAIAQGFPRSG